MLLFLNRILSTLFANVEGFIIFLTVWYSASKRYQRLTMSNSCVSEFQHWWMLFNRLVRKDGEKVDEVED
jgi:hypothetical protein